MTSSGILLILVFIAVIAALTAPLGAYMDKVFAGERTWAHKLLRPLEVAIYKLCGINEATEQHWTCYACGVLAISVVSMLLTYLILRLQQRSEEHTSELQSPI